MLDKLLFIQPSAWVGYLTDAVAVGAALRSGSMRAAMAEPGEPIAILSPSLPSAIQTVQICPHHRLSSFTPSSSLTRAGRSRNSSAGIRHEHTLVKETHES